MTVVIDTNALLTVLSLRHPHGRILDAWLDAKFSWALSNEILAEYEEILQPRIGAARWQDFLLLLELGAGLNNNPICSQPNFRFGVIIHDPDDNKFVDCAITANADWILTQDKHFEVLHTATYRPRPISPDRFIQMLNL